MMLLLITNDRLELPLAVYDGISAAGRGLNMLPTHVCRLINDQNVTTKFHHKFPARLIRVAELEDEYD
jgi:hypothetical protein